MPAGVDFIADTSAIIGLLRRDAVVEKKIRDKEFAITFVTLAIVGSVYAFNACRPNDGRAANADGGRSRNRRDP